MSTSTTSSSTPSAFDIKNTERFTKAVSELPNERLLFALVQTSSWSWSEGLIPRSESLGQEIVLAEVLRRMES